MSRGLTLDADIYLSNGAPKARHSLAYIPQSEGDKPIRRSDTTDAATRPTESLQISSSAASDVGLIAGDWHSESALVEAKKAKIASIVAQTDEPVIGPPTPEDSSARADFFPTAGGLEFEMLEEPCQGMQEDRSHISAKESIEDADSFIGRSPASIAELPLLGQCAHLPILSEG